MNNQQFELLMANQSTCLTVVLTAETPTVLEYTEDTGTLPTLKAMNLWYGFGAQAYTSTAFFKAITRNLIFSYRTENMRGRGCERLCG